MKIYKYDEWDFEWDFEWNGNRKEAGGFEDRVYVDLEGNKITGILEGFYGFSKRGNTQYVKNGKVSMCYTPE